ncbi:MAG TPA: nucleotidyltransferase [Myxococcota bacterium]|nr:nucleotidyltransferase [Myxococcota bacterium]
MNDAERPGAACHEGSKAGIEQLTEVMGEAVHALDKSSIDYVLIGGQASALLGRPRCSSDIDLLVTPESAPLALDALGRAGFRTARINPHWLFKAFRNNVLVDLMFKSRGDIYLDAEMLRRSSIRRFRGIQVRVVPPEDLIVMKAIVHDEETPRHWGDALAILTSAPLDWDYLLARSQWAPRRILSFLCYATSVDLAVPIGVMRRLGRTVLYD